MTVVVRGGATSEELAAVVAVLRPRPVPSENPYERWRRIRLAAVRRTGGTLAASEDHRGVPGPRAC